MNKNSANFRPLTPVSFLQRAASVYPQKTAVIHGSRSYNYREFHDRACRLASALARRGISHGDCVAVMAPNVPEMLEAHYAIPMLGAVLNPLNIRLDAKTIAFILGHGEAKALISDREYSEVIGEALALMQSPPLVIDIDDPMGEGGDLIGELTYEALLAEGDDDGEGDDGAGEGAGAAGAGAVDFGEPRDEWQSACLLYTSGTTGNPKGVLYHHRGAYLNALGNMTTMGLARNSVYLWTLPMFHCNGWTFTWAVTAACATHVCLRKADPALIYSMIASHGVTHMCGAPVVLNMLVHAPDEARSAFAQTVEVATGGAAPPSAVIEAMEQSGFRITHLYGLTESYGPALHCAWQDDWDGLDPAARSRQMARQGVKYLTLEDAMVADPQTMQEVPWDGKTMGELMLGGNTVMKGYLKNEAATAEAFAGGWFHSGDLAVRHPDGYIEIKDRSKDIIISGGENISSLEVEEVLYRHPKVMEAAVVARPHDKWGESPCAFVELKPNNSAGQDEIIAFCRDNLAGFKVPHDIVFGPLPKTATGKIQKYVLRQRAKDLAEKPPAGDGPEAKPAR